MASYQLVMHARLACKVQPAEVCMRLSITQACNLEGRRVSAGGGQAGAYGSSQGVRDLLGGLWSVVAVQAPTAEEQLAILGRAFPQLSALLPAGMAALSLVKSAAGQSWDTTDVSPIPILVALWPELSFLVSRECAEPRAPCPRCKALLGLRYTKLELDSAPGEVGSALG